jgi:hypothetical protein
MVLAPRDGIEPSSLVLIQSQAGPASRPTGDRREKGSRTAPRLRAAIGTRRPQPPASRRGVTPFQPVVELGASRWPRSSSVTLTVGMQYWSAASDQRQRRRQAHAPGPSRSRSPCRCADGAVRRERQTAGPPGHKVVRADPSSSAIFNRLGLERRAGSPPAPSRGAVQHDHRLRELPAGRVVVPQGVFRHSCWRLVAWRMSAPEGQVASTSRRRPLTAVPS